MKPFEEQFTAWVDGKLTGAELAKFEEELAAHPEAAADKAEALRLGALLRDHPAAPPLTNPDFFNHQLMQRIAAETGGTPEPEKPRAFFWSLPRIAWAGAFSLIVAFALFKTVIPVTAPAAAKNPYFAQVVEAWPADPSISATTIYNPEDKLTVVWLDGLDYIPASHTLQ